MNPVLPFTLASIEAIARSYPTPFHIYDEARIRAVATTLSETMARAGITGFQNYFAVKALPNPAILKILAEEGMGADCSASAEIAAAEMAGISGNQIIFSSNNTSDEEFAYAVKVGAVINFDDLSMIEPFLQKFGAPKFACCRFNPGNLSFGGVNESIIGSPKEAKYGMPEDQLVEAYQRLKKAGVKEFGIHTMLLSNDLDWQHHEMIASSLFGVARTVAREVGVKFDFINLGGGMGVPYRTEEHGFDVEAFADSLERLYEKYELNTIGSPRIIMENGRYITADSGYLVTQVRTIKRTHKVYVGVDASMSDLMRPGMYGAYHHITVLGKEDEVPSEQVDVVGSLCENNDKFAVDRLLPKLEVGDYIAIHTTGAHGHSMGFQYNGKLRSAELLLRPDGSIKQIRRAETLEDYFSTLTEKGTYHVPTN